MSGRASLVAIEEGMKRPLWSRLLAGALALLCIGLLIRGMEFYAMPLEARPEHDDYRTLAPSALWGQGYGVIGTALILMNLLYLLRRNLASWPLGSLRIWLEVHVFCGLAGAMLVLFHSAFQLRTPLAMITAASLLLVVLTGLIGRFLVSLAPKPTTTQLRANLEALEELMPGLGHDLQQEIDRLPEDEIKVSKSLLATLAMIPTWERAVRARKKLISDIVTRRTLPDTLDQSRVAHIKQTIEATQQLSARDLRSQAALCILQVWRRLHRFFAILMLLSVSVHIGVAWHYGYRWIFG